LSPDNTADIYIDNDTPSVYEYGSTDRGGPPVASTFSWWKGVMFYDDLSNPGRVYNSVKDSPVIVPTANYEDLAIQQGAIQAFAAAGERHLTFCTRGVFYCDGTPDETGGNLDWELLSADHGAHSFRGVAKISGSWVAFFYDGTVWLTNGNTIQDVGRSLKPLWDTINPDYYDRVVLEYRPRTDRLYVFIPSHCNIPNRGAFLDRPLLALGSEAVEGESRFSWWPMTNVWINCCFLDEYGALCGGDSRDGRIYQLDYGEDDDGEPIRASLLTSTSYGRAPETIDSWRYLHTQIEGQGGNMKLRVLVEGGKYEWSKEGRLDLDMDAEERLWAAGRVGPAVAPGASGIKMAEVSLPSDIGKFRRKSLPGHKGRSASIQVEFYGKGRGAKVRELGLEITDKAGRWGAEVGRGRTYGNITRVRWSRFNGVDLHADPAELGDTILAGANNMDPADRKAAKVRLGRRNLLTGRTPLDAEQDYVAPT